MMYDSSTQNDNSQPSTSDRRSIFFADFDHDSSEPISALSDRLRDYFSSGYTTLFMEFFFINIDGLTNSSKYKCDPDCQYVQFSNRINQQSKYVKLLRYAREIGFNVIGLSILEYGPELSGRHDLSRAKCLTNIAYRRNGPFDWVVAEIIRTRATAPDNFIVFLGALHWPILSKMMPLELVDLGKVDMSPSEDEYERKIFEQYDEEAQRYGIEFAARAIPTIRSEGYSGFEFKTLGKVTRIQSVPELTTPEEFVEIWNRTENAPQIDLVRARVLLQRIKTELQKK